MSRAASSVVSIVYPASKLDSGFAQVNAVVT